MAHAGIPLWMTILLDDPRRDNTHRYVQPVEIRPRARATTNCLVLIAHGSRDPRWRESFERLYATVRRTTSKSVKLAYMESINPTLLEVAAACDRDGVIELRVLPLFIASGAHVRSDIPQLADEVRRQFPHMRVSILNPVGEDPRMFSLLCEIIREKIA